MLKRKTRIKKNPYYCGLFLDKSRSLIAIDVIVVMYGMSQLLYEQQLEEITTTFSIRV